MFDISAVQKDKQTDGVWIDYDSNTSFLVAYLNNSAYLKTRERLEKAHGRGPKNKMSDETSKWVTSKAIAETVLKDWRGVGSGGKEIDYDPEIGTQALEDNPDLLVFIIEFAAEIDNYRREEVEEKAKK